MLEIYLRAVLRICVMNHVRCDDNFYLCNELTDLTTTTENFQILVFQTIFEDRNGLHF